MRWAEGNGAEAQRQSRMSKKPDPRPIRVFSFWDGGWVGECGQPGEFRARAWSKISDELEQRGYPDCGCSVLSVAERWSPARGEGIFNLQII